LVRVVGVGADPAKVAVAFESAARDRVHAFDGQREPGRYRRDVDGFDDSPDRPSLQSSSAT
jgi:hypothetical protein